MTDTNETPYEKNQRFNSHVSWLHSLRYKRITGILKKAEPTFNGAMIKVLDIGCAHAKLYSVLDERFRIDYTGIEIEPLFVEAALSRYGNKENFRIINDPAQKIVPGLQDIDLVVALETMEHIPERDVVRIIEAIAALKPKLFVCSVPVEIGPAIWLKNIGSAFTGYMRHKEYTWAETFRAGLYQLDKLPPHETKHKGFDWRWLAQTIRHNMTITETHKSPVCFLPAAFAFSMLWVTVPQTKS